MEVIDFEKTELRLGLPGGRATDHVGTDKNIISFNYGKRGFEQTHHHHGVDLKLKLSSEEMGDDLGMDPNQENITNNLPYDQKTNSSNGPPNPPAAKAQVVGWPPVRSFRKNIKVVQKNSNEEAAGEKVNDTNHENPTFVKVSLDGAPYLRKVDLKMYKNYKDLSDGLAKMFIISFTINGNCGSGGMKEEYMNEKKLMDVLNGSDYVQTYEDKDGDWMLVGDVPWEMFVGSCKRLRIMKGAEAIGLAPRAMEKCKNRS